MKTRIGFPSSPNPENRTLERHRFMTVTPKFFSSLLPFLFPSVRRRILSSPIGTNAVAEAFRPYIVLLVSFLEILNCDIFFLALASKGDFTNICRSMDANPTHEDQEEYVLLDLDSVSGLVDIPPNAKYVLSVCYSTCKFMTHSILKLCDHI